MIALLALVIGVCALNADGVPICRRDPAPAQTVSAPAWILDAMQAGTACEIGVDIYTTAPGEAWYAWREAHPDARLIERVQPESASVPDSWLFEADGEYVVFVFAEKLATRTSFVVHGLCARLIDGD